MKVIPKMITWIFASRLISVSPFSGARPWKSRFLFWQVLEGDTWDGPKLDLGPPGLSGCPSCDQHLFLCCSVLKQVLHGSLQTLHLPLQALCLPLKLAAGHCCPCCLLPTSMLVRPDMCCSLASRSLAPT